MANARLGSFHDMMSEYLLPLGSLCFPGPTSQRAAAHEQHEPRYLVMYVLKVRVALFLCVKDELPYKIPRLSMT